VGSWPATAQGGSGSLDEATQSAIGRCRFPEHLEQPFRGLYLERNLPRARSSTAIYLTLVVVVTGINLMGGLAPMSEAVLQPIYFLRIAVACPALLLILLATYWRALWPHYQALVGTAVVITGISVMAISGVAASSGSPQFQMGDVLVMVYGTLFLGLLIRMVVAVALALTAAFVSIGLLLGVHFVDLVFAASVLATTGLMAVLSARRVERLVRTSFIETRLLADIAERDGLTGLYNRRMFDTLARRLWQQAQRDGASLQVVLVDIDHFKRYNDLYGHQAGDDCIKQVAEVLASAAKRPLDFCARYGGEEFALVLYAPSGAQPEVLPEQIRGAIMALGMPHADSDAADVITVSIGSAITTAGGKRSLAGLIQKADEALYRAKQVGRNRVLHTDAGAAETPTGSFKVFIVK
jgi:diguanylate cyclase (GGDEF)-like protein